MVERVSTTNQSTTKAGKRSVLVLCAISDRKHKFSLKIYADQFKIERTARVASQKFSKPGTTTRRGKVTEFSKKSRKRLIDAFTQKRQYARPLFVTLTYPDEVWFSNPSPEALKTHLADFRKRLARFSAEAGAIWRVEIQDRKSGNHKGELAPHIHLIIDGLTHDPGLLRKVFHSWWTEILGMDARTQVEVAKSRRHANYYVTKYCAKFENCNQCNKILTIGRWWGIFGNWDRTPFAEIRLTLEELRDIRRTVSGWLKSRNSPYGPRLKRLVDGFGFTVYGLGAESSRKYHAPRDSAAYRLVAAVCGFSI